MVDAHGEIYRVLPMSDEMLKLTRNLSRGFRRMFGREPQGDDPMMLVRYLYSPDEMARMEAQSMKEAGVDPALIHAAQKTRRMVTAQNRNLLTDAELAEWRAAVEEFRSGKVGGRNSPNQRVYDSLMQELPRLITALAYMLDRAAPRGERVDQGSKLVSVDQYAFMCGLRAVKTLRSIASLLAEHRTLAALALSRTIYELYLHIIFVKADPLKLVELFDAQVGLWHGSHAKTDPRTITEIGSGKKFAAGFSHLRMSRASGRSSDETLFDLMYPHLSSFVHPNVMTLFPRSTGVELDPDVEDDLSEDDPGGAAFCSILFGSMLTDEVRTLACVSEPVKSDVAFVLRRIRRRAIRVLNLLISASESPDYFKVLRHRCREICKT